MSTAVTTKRPVDLSVVIERFLVHLFGCSTYLQPPHAATKHNLLRHYVAQVIRLTKLEPRSPIIYGALVLLNRMKERYPRCYSPSGHRLFLPALMVSWKQFNGDFSMLQDVWVKIGQSAFPKRELNQMERQLCEHLDWDFSMSKTLLDNFQVAILRDFEYENQKPLRPYPLFTTTKRPEPFPTGKSTVSRQPYPSTRRPEQFPRGRSAVSHWHY